MTKPEGRGSKRFQLCQLQAHGQACGGPERGNPNALLGTEGWSYPTGLHGLSVSPDAQLLCSFCHLPVLGVRCYLGVTDFGNNMHMGNLKTFQSYLFSVCVCSILTIKLDTFLHQHKRGFSAHLSANFEMPLRTIPPEEDGFQMTKVEEISLCGRKPKPKAWLQHHFSSSSLRLQ